jgi:thiol-disulfide isomerase/thioredoxin
VCAAILLICRTSLALPLAAAGDEGPEEIARSQGMVVWLDFWASWCTPCRSSFPWMTEMQQKYGPLGLTVIAVNLDGDRTDADRFLARVPPGFEVRFDPEAHLAKRFDVHAMPSSYVIGRTGEVLARHVGFKPSKKAQYEASIRMALGLEAAAR